jgi:hypothetical protein
MDSYGSSPNHMGGVRWGPRPIRNGTISRPMGETHHKEVGLVGTYVNLVESTRDHRGMLLCVKHGSVVLGQGN